MHKKKKSKKEDVYYYQGMIPVSALPEYFEGKLVYMGKRKVKK